VGFTYPEAKGIFWTVFSPIGLNGFLSVFLKQKCIQLVREKLTIFPHRQYINGIVIYSLLRFTLLRDRSWHLRQHKIRLAEKADAVHCLSKAVVRTRQNTVIKQRVCRMRCFRLIIILSYVSEKIHEAKLLQRCVQAQAACRTSLLLHSLHGIMGGWCWGFRVGTGIDRCEWLNVSYSTGLPKSKAVKRLYVLYIPMPLMQKQLRVTFGSFHVGLYLWYLGA